MTLDRFTWFGLSIALLGWIILITDAALSPFASSVGSFAMTAVLRSDIFTIAETTIFSGFALALLGTLRAGFGALHQFFGAVLQRASAPRSAPTLHPEPTIPPGNEPTVNIPAGEKPPPAEGRPMRSKNYTILDNGAVEVETLLGTRVFASLQEARDYIR